MRKEERGAFCTMRRWIVKKRAFTPAEGVSNIELFYDLIFVYCISTITSLMHHVQDGFPQPMVWAGFTLSYLIVLQVWFFTTFFINRYGDHSASDNVCLFVNMFLLYFLAKGIRADWEHTALNTAISWALILVNLIVHWLIKRFRYSNLDEDDKRIMDGTVTLLAVQLALVLLSAFFSPSPTSVLTWVALLFGLLVFTQSRTYRLKPARFAHLVERCSLIVIIAFGEMVVAVSAYMDDYSSLWYPVLVFALMVGLFLIYIYEHDNMIDHHKDTDGMDYLAMTGLVILILGNVVVALEYMPMDEVAFVPKSIYIMVTLVLYLLSSFMLGRYNKPEFTHSAAYTVGRLAACAIIVVVAFATEFHPLVNLACDVAAVYFALLHEWVLYRRRTGLMAFGRSIGLAEREDAHLFSVETFEGRRAIRKAIMEAREARNHKDANDQ